MSSDQYAGFWLRFVAYIIDYIIIQVLQSFIVLPILAAMGVGFATASQTLDFNSMGDAESFAMIGAAVAAFSTLALLSFAILILYYTLMESSKYQASFGKIALGLKVTDLNGNRLDFGRAFLRQISKIISTMIFMIGYIMAGLSAKKQALHDIIAGALVVKAK